MARDTMTYESYEPDSFDNPPKGPVGVHRGARSVMARLCPFIVVILVAALCGVGAWAWISGEYKNVVGGSSQTATTSKSDSSSKAETKNSTKDDVIVDERNNCGGWFHDDICTLLIGKHSQE